MDIADALKFAAENIELNTVNLTELTQTLIDSINLLRVQNQRFQNSILKLYETKLQNMQLESHHQPRLICIK